MIEPVLDKNSTAYRKARRRAEKEGWDPSWIRSEQDVFAVLDHGCWFNYEAGIYVVDWKQKNLCLWEGRQWAGKPFKHLSWQYEWVDMPMFGWMNKDGYRRFLQSFIEVGKKNGKSPLAASTVLYLGCGDGEPGATVACAANDIEQAQIVYHHAKSMAEQSPALMKRLKIRLSPVYMEFTPLQSIMKPLSSEAATKEGLNLHGLVFDEFHRVMNADLWDTLKYGGISRIQPLFVIITTAGEDMNTVWGEEHDYAVKILRAEIINYRYHAFVCCNPVDADFTDEKTWENANPSLGELIQLEEMRSSCQEAKDKPRLQPAFKRYRCNIPCKIDEMWLPPGKWAGCKRTIDWTQFKGRKCYAGLDLSTNIDMTAFVLLFPPLRDADDSKDKELDTKWVVLPHYWVPKDTVLVRTQEDKQPYLSWVEAGLLRTTPGPAINQKFIKRDILAIAKDYKILEIGFDKWKAHDLANDLADEGLEMVEVPQNIQNLSEPMSVVEERVFKKEIAHDGHPILAWNAGNVVVREDQNENRAPDKRKQKERIDGVSGLLNATARALRNDKRPSVYEKRKDSKTIFREF